MLATVSALNPEMVTVKEYLVSGVGVMRGMLCEVVMEVLGSTTTFVGSTTGIAVREAARSSSVSQGGKILSYFHNLLQS